MNAYLRVGLAAALVFALAAPAATAHEGNPNYRSEIDGLEPEVDGLVVSVLNYDDSVELDNTGDHEVVILGYDGEPYARIAPDGTVEVNERSPAYYINQDRYGEVELPAAADAEAEPSWQLVDRTGRFAWHDHRTHYMGTGTPPQVIDESKRTEVFDYEVPLEVDGEPVAISGTLFWAGEDGGAPIGAFAALALVAVGALAVVMIVRRRRGDDDDGESDGDDGPGASEVKEAW